MNRYAILLCMIMIVGALAGCTEDLAHLHEDGTEHTHEEGDKEHNHIVIQDDIVIDNTPRIAYWTGKINQHNENGTWISDPDGTSGADLDMLEYCNKWWPNTVDVTLRPGKEVITFLESGSSTEYSQENDVYECVIEVVDMTPRISYWPGKINQHIENGTWISDPDGLSGADIDMLEYCRKWWPETIAVKHQPQSEYITFYDSETTESSNHSSNVYVCTGTAANAQASDYSSSLITTSTVVIQASATEIMILTSFAWLIFALIMVSGKFEYRNYQANKMIDAVKFEEE